jgi:hypothetical protein
MPPLLLKTYAERRIDGASSHTRRQALLTKPAWKDIYFTVLEEISEHFSFFITR